MDAMLSIDAIGYSAGFATLITFAQRRIVPMRLFAVGANLLFISYGILGSFYPVALLHLILLPLNVFRLAEHLHMFWQTPPGGACENHSSPHLEKDARAAFVQDQPSPALSSRGCKAEPGIHKRDDADRARRCGRLRCSWVPGSASRPRNDSA